MADRPMNRGEKLARRFAASVLTRLRISITRILLVFVVICQKEERFFLAV